METRTALCIQAHAAAQESVRVCCPSWLKSGFDLIGIDGPEDELKCWPICFKKIIGLTGSWSHCFDRTAKLFHPTRLREMLMEMSMLPYDLFILSEYDSVIFSEPRGIQKGKFGAFIAGYCPESWGCGDGPFLHPPFICDKHTLEVLAAEAGGMRPDEDVGNGTMDVFMAILCKRAKVEIYQPEGVWSTNGLDMRMASKLMEARRALQSGCWHIHGIKRHDHLNYILGKTDEFPKDVIME